MLYIISLPEQDKCLTVLARPQSSESTPFPPSESSSNITFPGPPVPTCTDTANGSLPKRPQCPVPTPQWSMAHRPVPDSHHVSFISALIPHAPPTLAGTHGLNGQNMNFSLCYVSSVPPLVSISKQNASISSCAKSWYSDCLP